LLFAKEKEMRHMRNKHVPHSDAKITKIPEKSESECNYL